MQPKGEPVVAAAGQARVGWPQAKRAWRVFKGFWGSRFLVLRPLSVVFIRVPGFTTEEAREFLSESGLASGLLYVASESGIKQAHVWRIRLGASATCGS